MLNWVVTYGVKAVLNPSCPNSILEESPDVWVPVSEEQLLKTIEHEHTNTDVFLCPFIVFWSADIPSMAIILFSSVWRILFSALKSVTLNTWSVSGSVAIVFNSSFAASELKALPT